jgi:hypothetical protein
MLEVFDKPASIEIDQVLMCESMHSGRKEKHVVNVVEKSVPMEGMAW